MLPVSRPFEKPQEERLARAHAEKWSNAWRVCETDGTVCVRWLPSEAPEPEPLDRGGFDLSNSDRPRDDARLFALGVCRERARAGLIPGLTTADVDRERATFDRVHTPAQSISVTEALTMALAGANFQEPEVEWPETPNDQPQPLLSVMSPPTSPVLVGARRRRVVEVQPLPTPVASAHSAA